VTAVCLRLEQRRLCSLPPHTACALCSAPPRAPVGEQLELKTVNSWRRSMQRPSLRASTSSSCLVPQLKPHKRLGWLADRFEVYRRTTQHRAACMCMTNPGRFSQHLAVSSMHRPADSADTLKLLFVTYSLRQLGPATCQLRLHLPFVRHSKQQGYQRWCSHAKSHTAKWSACRSSTEACAWSARLRN
jgi:hypothetical protein